MKNIIDYKYMTLGTNQSRFDRYLNWSASGASSRSFARVTRHYSLIIMLFRDPRQITFVSRSSPTCRLRHDRFRTINNSVSVGRTRSILSRFRDLFASLTTENDEWIRFTRSKSSPLLNDISTPTDKKEPILRMQSSIVVSRCANTRRKCINKM